MWSVAGMGNDDSTRVRATTRATAERAARRLGAEASELRDRVVVEEPLEIRVDGEAIAVTMRTPGHDRELAVGFLYGEGVIASRNDVGTVTHCGKPGDEGYGNVIDVIAASGAKLALDRVEASRRGTLTTAACGVCGRRTIDDLMARCEPFAQRADLTLDSVNRAIESLRARQPTFAATGGLHAAAVCNAIGEALVVYEDIGRHNAVDKAIGSLVLAGKLPLDGAMLVVSGRASFEMVQKAVVARVGVIVSVSAVSSLAIDLAARMNAVLVGFAREGRATVY
jgi:FdhD protein